MASEVIQPIAEALAALADDLGMEGVVWPRGDLPNKGPWAVVGLPIVRRTAPEEREETGLGSNAWELSYTVTLLTDLGRPKASHELVADRLEAWVAAVDADRGLLTVAGTVVVIDSSVTESEPIQVLGVNRQLIGYETTVEILAAVAST